MKYRKKASLASIFGVQKNQNEENKIQREIITQGQHYKLYGVEGSTLKKNQLPPNRKKLHFTTETCSTRENPILLCFEDKTFLKRVAM
jgi:hypothetical protein